MKNKISNHDVSQNGGNLLLTTSAPALLLVCLRNCPLGKMFIVEMVLNLRSTSLSAYQKTQQGQTLYANNNMNLP